MEISNDFKKYRWFYTSSKKLVIGGKSAKQNDELLKKVKLSGKEYFIMHTAEPGSPFSVIISEINEVKKSDLDETAVFTGSFSRAWRSCKKNAVVDVFLASKLHKTSGMKEGTWGVLEVLSRKTVDLELCLTVQDKVLRAVPKNSSKSKDILLEVIPGKIDKTNRIKELTIILKNKFKSDEILSALPAGGVQIK